MADFVFGQTVAADAPAGELSGNTWIRKFKDGTTLFRVFPAVATDEKGNEVYGCYAWPWEWEHYDASKQVSYPCMRKYGQDCVGCASDNERVSKRSKQYYINAIDEDGNLRIFKMGQKLWESFERKQKKFMSVDPTELQPLSQRNYSVDRSGKDLGTVYELEAGDKYEVEFPEEYPSIPQALADAFNEAMEKYAGATPNDIDDEDIDDDEPKAKPAAKKAAAKPGGLLGNHSGGATKDGAAKPLAESQPEEEELPDDPTPEQIAHASTGNLRAWLTSHEVEFPARAPRSRLMSIIAKELEPPF